MHRLVRLGSCRHAGLVAALGVALVHGLLYVYLVPPWQHYDEPTHFEYVWLLADRSGDPAPGDFDQGMRREVAISMLENGFFYGMDFRPDLDAVDEPIWIGLSELQHRPLYYALAAAPLRLMRGENVETLLYVARLVSLLLMLTTVCSTWAITGILLPQDHPLRSLVPAILAMLPGFADTMTAVSNDVAAVAAFSLFMWASLRFLSHRSFSWRRLALASALAYACFQAKSTVAIAIPLLILAVALAAFRGRGRVVLCVGVLAAILGTAAFGMTWGDAAGWYRDSLQDTPTRLETTRAPLGTHVLHLEAGQDPPGPAVFQLLPGAAIKGLRGRAATLGAWMWASEPITVTSPRLYDSNQVDASRQIALTVEPVYHAFTVTLPISLSLPRVILQPLVRSTMTASVYYDGLVLALGAKPLTETPEFAAGEGADAGRWGGEAFQNLLRNASVEASWPSPEPRLGPLIALAFGYSVPGSLLVDSILDWPAFEWYFRTTAENMLRTFWGKFGWGHVPLLGDRPYAGLAVITVLGLLGAVTAAARTRLRGSAEAAAFLGAAMAIIWALAMLRGVPSVLHHVFIPGARYVLPAIAPMLLVLVGGWWTLLRAGLRIVGVGAGRTSQAIVGIFLGLDAYALVSLVTFYAGRVG